MSQLDRDFDETQEKVWLRAYEVPCWREEIASTGFSLAGRMANDRRSAAVARSLYKFTPTGRSKMFGQMQLTRMFQLG